MFRPDPSRGFLPKEDPLEYLPDDLAWLDDLGGELPLIVKGGRVRPMLHSIAPVPVDHLSLRQAQRAFLIYSFLASAYVWANPQDMARSIPAGIALPLYALAKRLGQPPIMSYNPYCLQNWRRIDPQKPIVLENLELLQYFSGVPDEAWFILDHVEIEAEAGPALCAIKDAQDGVVHDQRNRVFRSLMEIAKAQILMLNTLKRMSERCSPDVYWHSVRPYLFGFNGVVYEGVAPWKGAKRHLRGETGAQSAIVPALVAALGIRHEMTALTKHTHVMQYYMPPEHRQFVRDIRNGPSIRNYIMTQDQELKTAYNLCLHMLHDFRAQHYEWARVYIHNRVDNPLGSGGTVFMPWLKLLADETEAHLLK